MNRLITLGLLGAIAGLLSGCEVLYDIGQQSAAQDCERILEATQRNECVKHARAKGYADYEKQRQQLQNGSKSDK